MKKVFLSIIFLLLIGLGIVTYLYFKDKETEKNINNKISMIEDKFNEQVRVNKDTTLYKKENDNYINYGTIGVGNELILEKEKVTENTLYFNISGTNYYISYEDIEKIDSLKEINARYKKYIPFLDKLITKENATYTDELGNKITYKDSIERNIIIKNDDNYGIDINDRLYYVKKEDVKEVILSNNKPENIKDKIITLTYHFLYDKETDKCNQSICQSLDQFESHLKYLKDNDYLTLQMNELEMFLDKRINLPYKSLVITIDDGTIFNTKAIDLLEKYEQYATLFVITGWIENLSRFESKYLALESHTDLMHKQYECKGMGLQGGGILCKPEEDVLNDLKKSQEKLGGSKYLAYPFFDYNPRAIELLKKAGFNLAFIGQYNTFGFSTPGKTDKYKVPRKTIFNTTSMKDFENLLK